ncbi:hypothetical protein D3C81_2017710 [compost metagenome]
MRAPRQGAHFVGHHGETTALLAGPRRLDRRIECQQVGLLGYITDHRHHYANGLAGLLQLSGQPGNLSEHLRILDDGAA